MPVIREEALADHPAKRDTRQTVPYVVLHGSSSNICGGVLKSGECRAVPSIQPTAMASCEPHLVHVVSQSLSSLSS